MIYLDTHVLVRLYLGGIDKVSPAAREAMEHNGRLTPRASTVAGILRRDVGLRICDLPFPVVVEYALEEKWGRDPFDRLIVAQAKAQNAPLITKDEKIHRHYRRAIW